MSSTPGPGPEDPDGLGGLDALGLDAQRLDALGLDAQRLDGLGLDGLPGHRVTGPGRENPPGPSGSGGSRVY